MHGAIAEKAMDGNTETGTSLATQNCLIKLSIHIPVPWIPAIPAGMTRFSILVHNDERFGVGTHLSPLQQCESLSVRGGNYHRTITPHP